jgi:hypothetical protein
VWQMTVWSPAPSPQGSPPTLSLLDPPPTPRCKQKLHSSEIWG